MNKKPDFRKGFDFIMINAKQHFRAAEILSEQGLFGIANSHLILSSEEAVKAYTVFANYYDPELEIPDFNKYFSDHKHKHKAISDMSFFIVFMREIYNLILEPAKSIIDKKKDKLTKDDLIAAKNDGVNNLIKWLKTIPKIEHNEEWWNNANNTKNKGFYVNFYDQKWQTPSEICKDDYNKSYLIVKEVIDFLEMIPKVENSPELAEFYSKIKAIKTP